MTSAHIFFIPGMIMIGMFMGFVIGARATRNQVELQRRRDAEREAARAARAAKKAAGGDAVAETPKAEEPKAEEPKAEEPKAAAVKKAESKPPADADGPETKPGKRTKAKQKSA